jgi:hypothetical protein
MGAKVDPTLSHNNTGDGISQQTGFNVSYCHGFNTGEYKSHNNILVMKFLLTGLNYWIPQLSVDNTLLIMMNISIK